MEFRRRSGFGFARDLPKAFDKTWTGRRPESGFWRKPWSCIVISIVFDGVTSSSSGVGDLLSREMFELGLKAVSSVSRRR